MPAFPLIGSSTLRRGRVSVPGQVYLLTTTTFRRRRWFVDLGCARVACRAIHASATWGDAILLAWVLMPDHWHGLLQLGSEPLSRVVGRCKASVTQELHRQALVSGSVWDRGFHDHALRADEGVLSAARYLMANPVRAGLVGQVCDYPYWDAAWLDADARQLSW